MSIARICLLALVPLLMFAFLADVGALTVGGLFTADSYYLPLREIDVGASRDAIETQLIKTHTSILRHQRRLWCGIHGIALVLAATALFACKASPVDPTANSK